MNFEDIVREFLVESYENLDRLDQASLLSAQRDQVLTLTPAITSTLLRTVDAAAKKSILERIGRLLPRDGYLFLGAAETTMNLDDRFRRAPFERAGCYQLAA